MLISKITGGVDCQGCKEWASFVTAITVTITRLGVNGILENHI